MVCAACGTASQPDQKFCGECGERLGVTCAGCGHVNDPANRFCGECGAFLTATDTVDRPAEVEAVATAAGDVVQPAQERRVVTVVFADLCGFTPFSESRDPEEVRDFLTRYFEVSTAIIERFGGIVDKFIGDAVMGVWGAVTASEDDAERAVRAGLELVDAVAKLGADVGINDLALRVGALTGEAAVGPGANDRGLIIGDMVNTASRLHSIAPPGSVIVGETTYRLCEQAIAFEPLGDQELKGKSLPVAAWRALHVAGMRGGERRTQGLEAPFVGRDEELRVLKDQLHAVSREGRSRLVSISGIGGIGKSRLVWEFQKYVDGLVEDIYWHEGRSPAYGEGVALWALAEMVRVRARIAETDEPADATAKLTAMLDRYVPEHEERDWLEPRLAGLLGIRVMPEGERGELFSAFRRLFERISEHGTTVLVFEDLQWADAALLDFVEELTEWSREQPILVVTASRPELLDRRPTWGAGRRSFVAMHLGPLSDEAMRTLLAGLVPGMPAEAMHLLEQRAAGIPLYAIELVRMLLFEGRLVRDDAGQYRLVDDLGELTVPESLHAVIGARLDRLEPDDRNLVADAAVLGQTFRVADLSALTEHSEEALLTRLHGLVKKELLTFDVDPRSPERGQYGFVQSLIREVAYGRLSRHDRRARHLAIARHVRDSGDVELLPIVADHFLNAVSAVPEAADPELHDETITAIRSAAERSSSLHAHEQVLAYCDAALEFVREDSAAEWWERAALAAHALAKDDLAEQHAHRLVSWQSGRDDPPGLLRARHLHARILVESYDADRAVEVLRPVIGQVGDGPDATALLALFARALMLTGDQDESATVAERALISAERLDLLPVVADALVTRGTVLANIGRPREGVALLKAALEIARSEGLPQAELRATNNIAYTLFAEESGYVRGIIVDGLELARRLAERVWIFQFTHFLATSHELAGEFDAALAVLDALEDGEMHGAVRAGFASHRAIIAAFQGHLDEAHALLDAARPAREADTDYQRRTIWDLDQATVALTEGGIDRAYELAMGIIGASNPAPYIIAGRAAIHSGQRERLVAVRDAIDAFPRRSRALRATRGALVAALAVLDGDDEAVTAALDDAWRGWSQGFLLERAATLLAFARMAAGRHPAAGEAGREAREVLERIGAYGLLASYPEPTAAVDD